MVWISDTPKSEPFGNGTTLESAKIQTLGFQTFTVVYISKVTIDILINRIQNAIF